MSASPSHNATEQLPTQADDENAAQEAQQGSPLSATLPSHRKADLEQNENDTKPLPFSNPYAEPVESISNNHAHVDVKPNDDPASESVAKHEPRQTPSPMTPIAALDGAADNVDEETAKAIAAAQNEYGTRVRGPKRQDKDMVPVTDVDMSDAALKSLSTTATASKKRPPPKSTSTPKTPTSEIKKPPPKKRKIDPADDRSTPASSKQSPTPSTVSARASKTPAAKSGKASRPATPKASSPQVPASPGAASDASDDQVYCICRKPDNHTFMIGCDGGCDDWFHGKCVSIRKDDEGLIDKFICPNCVDKGAGVTTWKPMCRREGCRKPARLKKGQESKYCSRECGLTFMRDTLKRAAGDPDGKSPGKKAKTTEHKPPAESDIGPLGGRIRNFELKTLAQAAASVDEFRGLGSAPMMTPPPSVSPEVARSAKTEEDVKPLLPLYAEQEESRLGEIAERKAALRVRRQILKDRGQFVTLMKAQRDKVVERAKVKDTCGFDSRWSLDDLEFKKWRDSDEGRAAFETGSLESATDGTTVVVGRKDSTGDVQMTDDAVSYVCMRKRCERHRQWQKLVLQDVRFEEADAGNEMRKIDAEEREIKQRALDRAREQERQVSGTSQSYEGWVEVVAPEQGAEDPIDQDSAEAEAYGHKAIGGEAELTADQAPDIKPEVMNTLD